MNADSYASGDAVVLGQLAVILPAQRPELELLRGWEASVSVALTSNPDGAQIYVNDSLIGIAPATLNLSPGKHIIRVSLSGYKDWVREVSAESGAKVVLTANLEKED